MLIGLPSVLGPELALFQNYIGTETAQRVGAQHTLNADYFKRIDALNFTMQALDTCFHHGIFSGLRDHTLDLLLRFLNFLFNARRVNSPSTGKGTDTACCRIISSRSSAESA